MASLAAGCVNLTVSVKGVTDRQHTFLVLIMYRVDYLVQIGQSQPKLNYPRKYLQLSRNIHPLKSSVVRSHHLPPRHVFRLANTW